MYTRPHSALRTLSRSAGHGGCEMNIDAQMLRPGTSASSFAASQIAQIGWLKGPDGSKSQLILYENPSLRNKSIPNHGAPVDTLGEGRVVLTVEGFACQDGEGVVVGALGKEEERPAQACRGSDESLLGSGDAAEGEELVE
ncbi:hypothetical protein KC333_g1175 [Hortaea werneckii]|nr:hypothetical protein KC333_g1175 [Hortaea werneckii]KAI7325170.1 hypothetical protein KC326_g798 [Hortaea werneckii]